MLYKILLSLDYAAANQDKYLQASEQLRLNNWKKVSQSDQVWMAEMIAMDALTVKIKVERELSSFFKKTGLSELSYAFQLSLGDVSTGILKSTN